MTQKMNWFKIWLKDSKSVFPKMLLMKVIKSNKQWLLRIKIV